MSSRKKSSFPNTMQLGNSQHSPPRNFHIFNTNCMLRSGAIAWHTLTSPTHQQYTLTRDPNTSSAHEEAIQRANAAAMNHQVAPASRAALSIPHPRTPGRPDSSIRAHQTATAVQRKFDESRSAPLCDTHTYTHSRSTTKTHIQPASLAFASAHVYAHSVGVHTNSRRKPARAGSVIPALPERVCVCVYIRNSACKCETSRRSTAENLYKAKHRVAAAGSASAAAARDAINGLCEAITRARRYMQGFAIAARVPL